MRTINFHKKREEEADRHFQNVAQLSSIISLMLAAVNYRFYLGNYHTYINQFSGQLQKTKVMKNNVHIIAGFYCSDSNIALHFYSGNHRHMF